MNENVEEVIEILELILENPLPNKISTQLQDILASIKSNPESGDVLVKIQDELELVGASTNIDDYTRNEIINLVTFIESIYNA